MNDYPGKFFGTSGFRGRSRKQMEFLIFRCDLIFHLASAIIPAI
jgi:hypothetical protein